MDLKQSFHNKLMALQDGSYDVFYNKKRYMLSKETKLDAKLIKLYAKELGDNDFISLNYYTEKLLLKPCEMPEEKVIDFVINLQIDRS